MKFLSPNRLIEFPERISQEERYHEVKLQTKNNSRIKKQSYSSDLSRNRYLLSPKHMTNRIITKDGTIM